MLKAKLLVCSLLVLLLALMSNGCGSEDNASNAAQQPVAPEVKAEQIVPHGFGMTTKEFAQKFIDIAAQNGLEATERQMSTGKCVLTCANNTVVAFTDGDHENIICITSRASASGRKSDKKTARLVMKAALNVVDFNRDPYDESQWTGVMKEEFQETHEVFIDDMYLVVRPYTVGLMYGEWWEMHQEDDWLNQIPE